MNATKKLAAATLFLIAASIFTIFSLTKERKIASPVDTGQNAALILYYGDGCPHCKVVEDYIAQNNLQTKLDISEKEVWHNQTNLNELTNKARACGLDLNKLGIPMLWDRKTDKCYGGQTDKGEGEVIDFLSQIK